MIKTFKLFWKRYHQKSFYCKYYNITFSSWKFFLAVNFILMLYFFVIIKPDNSNRYLIELIKITISGIYISILTYVATIVIPERSRVKRLLNELESDLYRDLIWILIEAPINEELLKNEIIPRLSIMQNNFGMINREIGILRCSNKGGLVSDVIFLKKESNDLIKLLNKSQKKHNEIEEKIKLIKNVYSKEIIPRCKEIKGYYFLDWKSFYKKRTLQKYKNLIF